MSHVLDCFTLIRVEHTIGLWKKKEEKNKKKTDKFKKRQNKKTSKLEKLRNLG